MPRLLLAFLILSTLTTGAAEPWPAIKFTEVHAYAWPDDDNGESIILNDMSLRPGVLNPAGALLTADQVKILTRAMTEGTQAELRMGCLVPHNALVYYDENKRPVAFVEICFSCFNDRTFPGGTAEAIDLLAIASIFDAHKLPMGEHPNLAAFQKEYESVRKQFYEAKPRPRLLVPPSDAEKPSR